jgi:FtsH-binding integral membrane protein
MYAQSSLLKFIMMKKKQGKKSKSHGQCMSGGGVGQWQLGSILKDKAGFLAAVFGTLIFQLLLVIAIVKLVPQDHPSVVLVKEYWFVNIIIQFVLLLCLVLIPMPMPLKFALFTLFAMFVGYMLKVSLETVPIEIIQTALVGTIAVFVFFVVVGLVISGLGINLAPLGLVLLGMLLLLIIISVVTLFMKSSSSLRKGLAIATLFLFSVYIVFDTNQILQRDYSGDFVTAAIDYFLDILNIFLSLVSYSTNK